MVNGRPLNYTTTISVMVTAGECQAILAAAGAASVSVHYEDGQPAGLSFTLKTPHGARAFTLPVDIAAMHRVLAEEARNGLRIHSKGVKVDSREHAARVAWRVAKDWLEACLALIAAQMTTIETVMLPYLHVDGDKTLWQAYREREQVAIEAGGNGG